MKQRFFIFLVLLLAMGLVACGGSDAPAPDGQIVAEATEQAAINIAVAQTWAAQTPVAPPAEPMSGEKVPSGASPITLSGLIRFGQGATPEPTVTPEPATTPEPTGTPEATPEPAEDHSAIIPALTGEGAPENLPCGELVYTTFDDVTKAGVQVLGLYGSHESGIVYEGHPDPETKFFLNPHNVVLLSFAEEDSWLRGLGGQNLSYLNTPKYMEFSFDDFIAGVNHAFGTHYGLDDINKVIFIPENRGPECGGKTIWEYEFALSHGTSNYLQRGWGYFNLMMTPLGQVRMQASSVPFDIND